MVSKQNSLLYHQNLWTHQKSAISVIEKYFNDYQRGNCTQCALIHMPTGTGKSGVIASVSHYLPGAGCVLIIEPRIALRDQIFSEVQNKFFDKLSISKSSLKRVVNVKSAHALIDIDNFDNTIFVMTFQLLQSLRKERSPLFEQLKNNINLLCIDEGHYEPAIAWSRAIRPLQSAKVLFTATPFRDDLKLFDVSFDHSFSYTFHEAVRSGPQISGQQLRCNLLPQKSWHNRFTRRELK